MKNIPNNLLKMASNDSSECGANFCPSYQKVSNTGNDTMVGSSKPDDNLEVILVSIYLGCTSIGLLLTVFVLKPMVITFIFITGTRRFCRNIKHNKMSLY
jgi:hypothetical protein